MEKDLNIKPETVKLLGEIIGKIFLDIELGNDFGGFGSKSKVYRSKHKQVGLHQTKELLHNKGNY